MLKKKLLALTLALSGLVAGPAYSEKTIKFVAHADLKILDPLLTTGYITRNHGYMIYDTLFSMDKDYKPQPQMVDKYETSKDGSTWTFTLRDGLTWHDGAPVKAEDCIASLNRWGKVDGFGQLLYANVKSLEVVNEKTFKIHLNKPFPSMLAALGKMSSNVPFMMPKRIAETDHKTAIEDYTGSGPFIFNKDEWKPGSKYVYVKNTKYVPRKEPASLAAGGKVVKVDRVEWLYLPDATITMAALQKGEIDYWENPPTDLLPLLEKDPNLITARSNRLMGILRFNSLIPPFNNPKIREAVMMALDQNEYLASATPSPKYSETCYSVFACGTPYANDAMSDTLKKSSLEKAKAALKDSGYDGTPVVFLHTSDIPSMKAFGMVTVEKLREMGMNVDMQTMDNATLLSRRGKKESVKDGGWNMFNTIFSTVDLLDPSFIIFSGNAEKGWVGWFSDAELETARKIWVEASDEKQKMDAARKIQERILGQAAWAPLGIIKTASIARKSIKGSIDSPIAFLWNIEKLD